MKRTLILLLSLTLLILPLTACRPSGGDGGNISVVATVFPAYDWAREVVGDTAGISVELLLDSGVDMHSYQPTAADILTLSECDLFICIGGGSDGWVDGLIASANNPSLKVLRLTEVEGITLLHSESDHSHGHGDECEHEKDEHIWMSLSNAEKCTDAISALLSELSPDQSDALKANAEKYADALRALDGEYRATVAASPHSAAIFADRFPFVYLTESYGIEAFAAFPGCSSEADADFETVISLAGKLDELGLGAVIVTESSDGSVARAVIDASSSKDAKILLLNSMQTYSSSDIQNGSTYLSVMKDNLTVLKTALGG